MSHPYHSRGSGSGFPPCACTRCGQPCSLSSGGSTCVSVQGPQGVPGRPGDVGPAGSTGPIGLRGATGPAGQRGATGRTGAAGVAGYAEFYYASPNPSSVLVSQYVPFPTTVVNNTPQSGVTPLSSTNFLLDAGVYDVQYQTTVSTGTGLSITPATLVATLGGTPLPNLHASAFGADGVTPATLPVGRQGKVVVPPGTSTARQLTVQNVGSTPVTLNGNSDSHVLSFLRLA